MKTLNILFIVSLLGLVGTALDAQKELGEVKWLRNYDEAVAKAEAADKPILLLFQEVPGCATCRNYGEDVLSHPLVVDAIENEFVPLAIFNNVGGHDRKILDKYDEPTWNNPVVRVIDAQGKDVMSRLAGNYTAHGLALQMSLALRQSGKALPAYLDLLVEELESNQSEDAYYEMYCFWSGEAHLGNQEGVVATEPGFMNGAEVVKVTFDDSKISKKKLDRYAEKAKCKPVNNIGKYRKDKDPQYYLKRSPYKTIPLSPIQKTKINALLAAKQDARHLLSPTQREWLDTKALSAALYDLSLEEAWAEAIKAN